MLKITREEGKDIVYECLDDWEKIEENVVDTSRWSIRYVGIFKHIPSGKYYQMSWSVGATEYQDERPFDYEDPDLIEVEQVEVKVLVWQKKEKVDNETRSD